jgi:cyclic pyranopterin phosphate synthase
MTRRGGPLVDRFERPLTSLRVSVTDRCNMRCRYCMPEAEYAWLPKASILTFEEIDRLVGVFTRAGVTKVRLTGGEPLLRKDLATLVARIAARPELRDIALTTNGILLASQAAELRAAGLQRVTVSLDTLRPERMLAFARSPRHGDILEGIAAAGRAGLKGLKLNTVVIRGYHDDEVPALLAFGREHRAEVRFIEYMDVGGATGWSMAEVVSQEEILERLTSHYGPIVPFPQPASSAPASRFQLPDGTRCGIIASTTRPFCRSCDRARLTADGHFLLCLYADQGLDLREILRGDASDQELLDRIRESWAARDDRGAELRAGQPERVTLYSIEALRADPRREMHTRGG